MKRCYNHDVRGCVACGCRDCGEPIEPHGIDCLACGATDARRPEAGGPPWAWGKRRDKWADERDPFHALTERNAPRCGASHFAMGGALLRSTETPHGACRRCARITRKGIDR